MTFSYDPTLPNPPHDPTDDVDQMQTNSASIASILVTDHVGFNVAQGGQHNQVTFSKNQAAPALPAGALSEIFANSFAGLFTTESSLFFTNANRTLGLTNLQLTQNSTVSNGTGNNWGLTTPWGLIINFGTVSPAATPQTITFAIPMNTARYTVVANLQSNNPTADHVTTNNFTATTFQIVTTKLVFPHYYIAIGS